MGELQLACLHVPMIEAREAASYLSFPAKSIKTLSFAFLFLPPNEYPRTRSDWGGRGGDIVRHLHGGAIPKPDVSREHTGTFNPDLGALTTTGLGTELPVGLGRSSTPWAEKGKACSQKSSNHLELSHPWHVFSFLFIGF